MHIGAELGGGGTLTRAALEIAEAGLRRVLHLMELLVKKPNGEAPPTRFMEIHDSDCFVYAPDSGFFEPLVELGDEVKPGQPAGIIHFPDTPWREPSIASFQRSGTVICKRILCRAERGDCLFHLATPYKA